MTTKQCRVCTRTLPLDMFHRRRTRTGGERIVHKCRQCHAADCARRKHEIPGRQPDPMNDVMRLWRGPVRRGQLRAVI